MARQLISGCVEQLKDIAGPMISGVLGQLGSTAYEMTVEEVKAVKDIEKEVKKLTSELTAIQAVLEDADKRQYKEAAVRDWLDKLKDVSHDIDDVLDEWITAIKKVNLGKEEQKEGEDPSPSKKVRLNTELSLSASSIYKLALRRDIASRIKELNEMLDIIAVEKSRYSFNTTCIIKEPERPKTTSFVNISNIYGRDSEKEVLIGKLCERKDTSGGVEIIPIVGMGGIGKTTLAQLAYHDNRVKMHFEKLLWICVSEPFDEKRVAKAIIEALDHTAPNLEEMDSLLGCVRESIMGKRFLFVLDDVWTDDAAKWEPLREALKSGDTESRILVTARKKEVALMMRAENNMISIELLSDEICWCIFSQLAFSGRDRSRQLVEIGKQIAMKCKGLPLVAKILGSLMHSKTRIQQWNDILRSELWELEKDQDKNVVFAPFLLSFNDLPSVEKRCLLYCSTFPKDHVMPKDNLIQLWMSQGYLSGSKNLEREGLDCFENLAKRSFFQDFKKDRLGNIVSCKMHDIMHDFVQLLTKNECCVMDVKEKMEYTRKKIRHATLLPESGVRVDNPGSLIYESKGLRALFVASSQNDWSASCLWLERLFLNLTCLRILNFSYGTFEELPEGIGELIHLRYLDLSRTRLKELPDSLCDLFNLQILRVIDCFSLEQLPQKIGKLINVRHLHIDGCHRLESLPKGNAKLSGLRTLDMFVVPDYNCLITNGDALEIEDLHMLKELQDALYIRFCGNLRNGSQAERAQLKDKEYLVSLELHFNNCGNGGAQDEILEALEPRPNLESLDVGFYTGSTISPNWMIALVNLKRLKLVECPSCEFLPPLGKLPALESLEIYDFSSVERVGIEFLGIENDDAVAPRSLQISSFPKLKRLRFGSLQNWKKWELGNNSGGEEEDNCLTIMPSLESLKIWSCRSLEALPDFIRKTPLQHLRIKYCPILKERCREGVGEDWPKISHIPNIQLQDSWS